MGVKNINIIFESPKLWQEWLIRIYLLCGFKVWVVEPFAAYHHNGKVRFFPARLSEYLNSLIQTKKIKLLTAQELETRKIFNLATSLAVESTEEVFPLFKKYHSALISCVKNTFNSIKAEDIFKKELCDCLASFYSVNIILSKIKDRLPGASIKIYPDVNILSYLLIKGLLIKNNQRIFMHDNSIFSLLAYLSSFIKAARVNTIDTAKVFIQTVGAAIFGFNRLEFLGTSTKETYEYGITIINPARQLAGNQRKPNFIVGGNKINSDSIVYLLSRKINIIQQQELQKLGSRIYYLPNRKWGNFSHFSYWVKLLRVVINNELFKRDSMVNIAHLAFSEYFRWKKAMRVLGFRNLITHADFGSVHIARNILLNQLGVKTWYFIDSINYPFNFQTEGQNINFQHPVWTYLYYDYVVTWEESLSKYFSGHPNSVNKYFVIGCLWADNIREFESKTRSKNGKFTIAVFDSTYSCNSVTSYTEGIAFANDILKLAEELEQGLEIIFKEKRERSIHMQLDAVLADQLVALYDKMSNKNNIKTLNNNADSAEIMCYSDMVISFPFTSTTFEALSANKPAIWHDPLGYYKDTIYAKIGGVTTHSYDELKARVIQIRNMKPGDYKNPIPLDSAYMDPYRDGKAIERFRDLLISENERQN